MEISSTGSSSFRVQHPSPRVERRSTEVEERSTSSRPPEEQSGGGKAELAPSGADERKISKEEPREEQREAEEQEELARLKKRDREVKAHEHAHLASLGAYRSGSASFTYESGPDGARYAVDGEVSVDTSPEETPEETIAKAQVIRRAALAPAEPSAADRSVAAQATQMEAQARAELAKEQADKADSSDAARPAAAHEPTSETAPPSAPEMSTDAEAQPPAGGTQATQGAVTRKLEANPYAKRSVTCGNCGVSVPELEAHNHLQRIA